MPSVSEPFGLTPLEAAVYGTPSLISKQSGIAEVLRSCLRVDFWDTDEMANKMIAVIREKALREQLAESVQQEVFTHSWQKAADRIWEVYNHHIQKESVMA
jgi:glycogen(starch) synthase